jgi:ribosomal protein L37E
MKRKQPATRLWAAPIGPNRQLVEIWPQSTRGLGDAEMATSLHALCRSCGKRVAKDALVCPSCGALHPGKKLPRSFLVFFVAIALLSLLAAAATTLLK